MTSAKRNGAVHQEQRLALLESFRIMDTPRERSFDLIAEGLARLYGVPYALISFIDGTRQFFKAGVGTDLAEVPVGETFCQHTLTSDNVLVIPDTTQDARSALHPLVTGEPGFRFYAGAPIITGRFRIGTVCVLDTQPHDVGQFDLGILTHMALMVAVTLETRKLNPGAEVVYPRYRAQEGGTKPN